MERINRDMILSCIPSETTDGPTSSVHEADGLFIFQYNLPAGDCFFNLSRQNQRVEIHVRKAYFDKYAEGFTPVSTPQQVCCNTQARLYEIIRCKLKGLRRRLFLESAALYLIGLLIELPAEADCENCTIAAQLLSSEKVNRIKSFIINHLSENLTIPIVANFAGINQCYLKRGFKNATGQTIFDFIQQNRMAKARHLLQNADMQITDVAIEVGYSSLSSFSQAFKNMWGINPSAYCKEDFPQN